MPKLFCSAIFSIQTLTRYGLAQAISYVYAKNVRGYLLNLQHYGKISPTIFNISLQYSLNTNRLLSLKVYINSNKIIL
jgi:hypothetical protein